MSRSWIRPAVVVAVGILLLSLPPGTLPAAGPSSSSSTLRGSLAGTDLPSPSPSPAVVVAPAYRPTASVEALGPLAPTAPIELVVGLAPRDAAGLEGLAAAVSVPGSPLDHRHLSAPDAAARFGAPGTDVATAERYFASFGLSVTAHPDGLLLSISGPSSAVAAAFGTTFEAYRSSSGTVFFDHPTPARLPSIAPWTGALGLGDSHPIVPAAIRAPTAVAAPSLTCPPAGGAYNPCDIEQAYSMSPLYANASGLGFRIGIVDAYSGEEPQNMLNNDFATFTGGFGLPRGTVDYLYPVPTTVDLNASGTNPGWGTEEALDLEWARAAAPNATLVMTFSPNAAAGLYFAIDTLVASRAVDVISMSWGEPDVGQFNPGVTPCYFACNASTDGSYAVLAPVLELAAVEGISSFAATGDCGSADGTAGVSTNFPSSLPWVTAVGGTNLTTTSAGAYKNESAWSGNQSGATAPGCQNGGGSGGGFSPFPRPWWQHGVGTRSTVRGTPDVALDAGIPVQIVQGGLYAAVAGTSVATPIWAGIAAIADQYAGHALGLLNPGLYALLNSTSYAATFHDITTGSNGYRAGTGWDPVTGIGSPIVSALVKALVVPARPSPGTLQTFVYAAPRFGPAPLNTTFAVSVTGGSGTTALEGVAFGDGNASLTTNGSLTYLYPKAGVYSAVAFAVDSNGTTAISPPVVVVVGGGRPLSVTLTASNPAPAVGANVTFTATVNGSHAPFFLNLSFGDGAFAWNLTSLSANHSYVAAGSYCVEAVVRDSATPPDGGASARVAVAVGGATARSCGNPSSPLTVAPLASLGIRDAPADFPSLFSVAGGSLAPLGLAPTVSLAATDPYVVACGCSIFRAPGNYSVTEWVNDTVNGEANATENVTVWAPLNATFTASTLTGPAPLTVNFSVSVLGGYVANAAATFWNFGDGQNATGATVSATYATPGEYLAFGWLSDRGHGNASEAFLIDVQPTGPPVLGVAGSIGPVIDVPSGTNVTFQATLQGPSSVLSTAQVRWNMGNGHLAFGTDITETYFAGVDLLTANTLSARVSVFGPYLVLLLRVPLTFPSFFASEAGGFVPAASALAFDATVVPATGVVPLAVWGNATPTAPGGANVTWQFGDTGSAGGLNVTHVYYGADDYTVTATAYDPFNDVAVRLNAVSANTALGVLGGPSSVSGDAPLTVAFSVVAYGGAGPPYTYAWDFPGGNSSGVANLTLTFPTPGRYTVTLKVTDQGGSTVPLTWTITVVPVPSISFLEVVAVGAAVGLLAALVAWRRRPPPGQPFTL